MKLAQLIDLLTELVEDEGVDPETLVMIAHQPRYPLQTPVDYPTLVRGGTDGVPDVVYLPEAQYRESYDHPQWGRQEFSPYAPRSAFGGDD